MADRKPILNLDTLVERAVVAIDGQAHELKNVDEFSILESIQMGKKSEQLRALFADGHDPTDEDVATLEADINWICRKVLMAPAAVHDRLTTNQRFEIVMAFTNLRRGMTAPPAGATKRAPKKKTGNPSTGGSSSPA